MNNSKMEEKEAYRSTQKLFSSHLSSLSNGKQWGKNKYKRNFDSPSPSHSFVKSDRQNGTTHMINITTFVHQSHYFISLTTIPSRFCHLEFTLRSLDVTHITAILIHLPLFAIKDKNNNKNNNNNVSGNGHDKEYHHVSFPYHSLLFEENEINKHFVNKIKIIFHKFDFGPILKQVGTAMFIEKYFGNNNKNTRENGYSSGNDNNIHTQLVPPSSSLSSSFPSLYSSPSSLSLSHPLSLSRPSPSPSNTYVIAIDDDALYHPLMIQEMIYHSSLHPFYIMGNMGQNGEYWNFSSHHINQSLFNPLSMGNNVMDKKMFYPQQQQQQRQQITRMKIKGKWREIQQQQPQRACCDVLEGFAGVITPLSSLSIPLLLHFSSPFFSPFCYVSDDLVMNFVWGGIQRIPRMKFSSDKYSLSWTHLPDNGNDDSLSRGRGIKGEIKNFKKKNPKISPPDVNRKKYQKCLEEMRNEKIRMERERESTSQYRM